MSTPETIAQDVYEELSAHAVWESMVHDGDEVALRGDVMVTTWERVCSMTIYVPAGDYEDYHDDVVDSTLVRMFGIDCELGWKPTGYERGQWLPRLRPWEDLERREAWARGEWWVVR